MPRDRPPTIPRPAASEPTQQSPPTPTLTGTLALTKPLGLIQPPTPMLIVASFNLLMRLVSRKASQHEPWPTTTAAR